MHETYKTGYTFSFLSFVDTFHPYASEHDLSQATDPDMDDQGKLLYALVEPSSYFDIDISSGLLYVVSAEPLAGQSTVVDVTATDPGGLKVMTSVKVCVCVCVCVCVQQRDWSDTAIHFSIPIPVTFAWAM